MMNFVKNDSKYIDKKVIENTTITNIEVQADITDIFVTPSEDDHFHLEHRTNNEDHKMEVMEDGDTLYVKSKTKKIFNVNVSFNISFTKQDNTVLTIAVPKRVMNQLTISSSVGDVHVKEFEAKEVNVTTSTGTIDFMQVLTQKIETNAITGAIKLKDVGGNITAHASTGDIKIHPIKETNMKVKTSTGGIKIKFPFELENTTITAKTSVGSIKVFDKKNKETVFGKGEHLVQTKTSVGDIKITYK